jgi:hypothetical protein
VENIYTPPGRRFEVSRKGKARTAHKLISSGDPYIVFRNVDVIRDKV